MQSTWNAPAHTHTHTQTHRHTLRNSLSQWRSLGSAPSGRQPKASETETDGRRRARFSPRPGPWRRLHQVGTACGHPQEVKGPTRKTLSLSLSQSRWRAGGPPPSTLETPRPPTAQKGLHRYEKKTKEEEEDGNRRKTRLNKKRQHEETVGDERKTRLEREEKRLTTRRNEEDLDRRGNQRGEIKERERNGRNGPFFFLVKTARHRVHVAPMKALACRRERPLMISRGILCECVCVCQCAVR